MKVHPEGKRPANEPLETLLTHSEGSEIHVVSRPAAIVLGALFVFGRGLAGLFWLAVLFLLWPTIAKEAEVPSEDQALVLGIILAVGGIAACASLGLAWLIWRGSNFARVLVMFGVTISIVAAAIDYFVYGVTITIQTTLLTLSLDILVLLALSSRDARMWVQQPRTKRSRSA